MLKPRLSEPQAKLALYYWRVKQWDTTTISIMLNMPEAAVYNSLHDLKGGNAQPAGDELYPAGW